jgi:hypothetical protein
LEGGEEGEEGEDAEERDEHDLGTVDENAVDPDEPQTDIIF